MGSNLDLKNERKIWVLLGNILLREKVLWGKERCKKNKESQGKDKRISHLEAIIHYPSSIHNFDNDLKTYLILLY